MCSTRYCCQVLVKRDFSLLVFEKKNTQISNALLSNECTQIYKIVKLLKTIKLIKAAPTCFGSRRNHHHGVLWWHIPARQVITCHHNTP